MLQRIYLHAKQSLRVNTALLPSDARFVSSDDMGDWKEPMQTRIIASLAGTALGLLTGSYMASDFGLSGTTGYVVFGIAGLALGNVVSVLVDVFSGSAEASHNSTSGE